MPKRDVSYTEITCDRCGKRIQLVDKNLEFRHLVVVTRYTQVWFGKLWNPRGRTADYYLCEDCVDVLINWLEGDVNHTAQEKQWTLNGDDERREE